MMLSVTHGYIVLMHVTVACMNVLQRQANGRTVTVNSKRSNMYTTVICMNGLRCTTDITRHIYMYEN